MQSVIDILNSLGSAFVDDWYDLDSWIVITAALAAIAC